MEFIWQQFKGERFSISGFDGEQIPFLILYPQVNIKKRCALLLHGITGSKEDWLTIGGFAKGGDLTQALLNAGWAVAVPDARLHGDRKVKSYPSFQANFNDIIKQWNSFYSDTYNDIGTVLDYLVSEKGSCFEELSVIGFSLGGFFTYALAASNLYPEIQSIVVLANAMIPQDDSLGNPLVSAQKINKAILIVVADKDEYYPIENAHKIFNVIPIKEKQLEIMHCGHDLDIEYVPKVISWLK